LKVRAAGPLFAILLVVTGLVACGEPAPGGGRTTATLAPEPVSPRGAVTLPFVFSWKPASGQTAAVYRVSVSDTAERVLFEQDVRGTECGPSGEVKEMMADHATFTWTVGVLSADGASVVARSAPLAFSLK
jgi:hypothetical protein